MADELVNMSSQFKGLPLGDLIGGPLIAACDAQLKLANATADFIKTVGFLPPAADELKKDPAAVGNTRTALFKFTRPTQAPDPDPAKKGQMVLGSEDVTLEIPLLALVKVPALSITSVDIIFDMEVKSSFTETQGEAKQAGFSADASVGWGPFSAKVHVQGSVSSHKENTRSSDNSAKYHVEVRAQDAGMPEGLARVLDILQTSIAPKSISPPALPPK